MAISKILENDLGKQLAVYKDLKRLVKSWEVSLEEIIYILNKYNPKYTREDLKL